MHTHTLEVSGVLPGPIGGWGVFFFFFLQSFYFLFVSCKLRDIGDGWERGCSTSSALLWALAHHCISHHTVDVYRACRSQQVPWKIGSYLGVMPRQSLNSKSLVFFCFSVNLCLIGWKKTKNTHFQQVEGYYVAEVRRMNISGDCSGLLPLLCKAITVTC